MISNELDSASHHSETPHGSAVKAYLLRHRLVLVLGWTIALTLSALWQWSSAKQTVEHTAREHARAAHQKDVIYRRWNATLGGVYAEVSPELQPNPHLDVTERDIQTPSGRELTLVNPAYMTRQVHAINDEATGVRGHITSLQPLRPENQPDSWETEALKQFEAGTAEVSEIVTMDGQRYMRLMRPLAVQPACMKCHAHQGYQVGDVRGGISVAVPMKPLEAIAGAQLSSIAATHVAVWLIGVGGMLVTLRRLDHLTTQRESFENRMARLSECFSHLGTDAIDNISQLVALCGQLIGADSAMYNRIDEDTMQVVGRWKMPPCMPQLSPAKGKLCSVVVESDTEELMVMSSLDQSEYASTTPLIQQEGYKTYVGKVVKCGGSRVGSFCAFFASDYQLNESDAKIADLVTAAISAEEERLRNKWISEETQERYECLVNNVDVGIMMVDCDLNLMTSNGALSKIFCIPGTSSQSAPCYKQLHNRESPCEDCPAVRCIETGETVKKDLEFQIAGQKELALEVKAFPIFAPDTGEIAGVVELIQDVTENKKSATLLQEHNDMMVEALRRERKTSMELEAAMEQLRAATDEAEASKQKAEAATKAKSEFLANMSHEIRTPMTAILGFAEELSDVMLSEEDRKHAISTIQRNGHHLLQLINDILDLSKIEAGRFQVEHVDCSPAEIISEITSLIKPRAHGKGVEFVVEYQSRIPETIKTDPTRFRQIMLNMLGNAVKFTEIGEVRLNVQLEAQPADNTDGPSEPHLRLEVKDTGIGISPEHVERLFQPFSQADASTTRKFGGTGLGLMISKRLAEQLGGTITVESELHLGSTFTVTLATGPLDDVELLDMAEYEETAAHNALAGDEDDLTLDCHILLAEDGPDNQRLISHVLSRAGARVEVVSNGKMAIDRAMGGWYHRRQGDPVEPFDVILMDMQMPVMDGYEATRLLRSYNYPGLIIALTAHAMPGDRDKCLDAGCDDFTTKPIDRKGLIRRIRENLKGHGGFMSQQNEGQDILVSQFADDPDMRDLVEMFVDELPERVTAVETALAAGNLGDLASLAHQIKGAAGGYGFPSITDSAAAVEQAAKTGQELEEVTHSVQELAALCRSARATTE